MFSMRKSAYLFTAIVVGLTLSPSLAATAAERTASTPPLSSTASPTSSDGGVTTQGATCDAGIVCGAIRNYGSVSFKATTKYISPTQIGSGAHQYTVPPGGRADAGGSEYDWDAYFVPNGYCGTLYGGPFWSAKSTMNNVSRTAANPSGTWHKVDDFGGKAAIKKGSCPS